MLVNLGKKFEQGTLFFSFSRKIEGEVVCKIHFFFLGIACKIHNMHQFNMSHSQIPNP